MERKTFKEFCNEMHQRHLYECPRETNYTEVAKPYNEYVISNLNFLYTEYERQKSKQARKDMDELLNTAGVHSL